MKRVYFDNAATTKIDDAVVSAMIPYLSDNYGNASSAHAIGKPNKVLLEDTRDLIADFIGAKPKEIFFTSGGTESNNFALKGNAFANLEKGRNHIITSSIEHLAVLDSIGYLNERFGFEVTYIKPDSNGNILPDDVRNGINEKTFLVSVMHSNNETGRVNDIKKISEITGEVGASMHTDSVQSLGKMVDLNVKDLGVNTATFSAHKIYGPKGIGVLYIKDGTVIDKYMHGGSQERNMRGGTENIPAIAGLKKAVEILKDRMDEDVKHYGKLKSYLVRKLGEEMGDTIFFNSGEDNSLSNIVNFSFDSGKVSIDDEVLLIKLDLKGIAVSGGSACTSGTLKPSHVIMELGQDEKTALNTIRVSFGRYNTIDEVDYFVGALKEISAL